MKIGRVVGAGAVILFAGLTVSAAGKRPRAQEQTFFSAEDEAVKRPVALPKDAQLLLEKNDRVRHMMENQDPPVTKAPASWFSASTIHLAGNREEDLVVMAVGELHGANVTMFWVLRPATHGYEVILAGPAHDLIVKRTRWRGYREIELFSATAVECSTVDLRFDGTKYDLYRTKSGPIPDC